MTESIITVGLGFGDEGKGSIVDFLCRTRGIKLVVRYCGGSQAAHNVVLPDGKHHTFSQLGSGSFWPGVRTILAEHMLVDPITLYNEAQSFYNKFGIEILDRIHIHENCRIITPYHVALNRLRELTRGDARHGSCGMGIGETVSDYLVHDGLYAKDLLDGDNTLHAKLETIRQRLMGEAKPLFSFLLETEQSLENKLILYRDPKRWLKTYWRIANEAKIISNDDVISMIRVSPSVFEGAQGVGLDENYGFHPYTTWATTTTKHAEDLLNAAGVRYKKLGVLRTYATRHGAGPFVTETKWVPMPDLHNEVGEWQGAWRTGYLDIPLLRYTTKATGGVDELALTHCDVLKKSSAWPVCLKYDFEILGLLPMNIEQQVKTDDLTRILTRITREHLWSSVRLTDPEEVYSIISEALRAPITIKSFGPTWKDKENK